MVAISRAASYRTRPRKRSHQFIIGMGERDLSNLTVIGGDAGLESLQLSHQCGCQATRQDHRGSWVAAMAAAMA
jgi:hypothetical protein